MKTDKEDNDILKKYELGIVKCPLIGRYRSFVILCFDLGALHYQQV